MTAAASPPDPGDDQQSTEATARVAEAVLARLAHDPAILDVLADQLAERIADSLAPRIDPHISQSQPAHVPARTEDRDPQAASELLNWVTENWPTAVHGDPQHWATAIAHASTTPTTKELLEWAKGDNCPTPFWQSYESSVPAPKAGQHTPRSGPLAQMLAEYAAEEAHPGACRLVDTVCAEVHSHVRKLTARGLHQRPVVARKNALVLLREHGWDATHISQTIEWGLRHRPHWRSNLTGVPAPATFNKIDGDWLVDPANFNIADIDPNLAATITTITDGWTYYLSHRLDTPVHVTAKTHKNIHDSLAGSDGGDPITEERLKAFVRWVFRADSRDVAYYADGNDFPPMRSVRRGLLAMASRPSRTGRLGEGITTTSDSAGGSVGTTSIPVKEV